MFAARGLLEVGVLGERPRVVDAVPARDDGDGVGVVHVPVDAVEVRARVMTTLEQPGLDREPGMLKALARVNRQTNKVGTFACLGAYAKVSRFGPVRVGDDVSIA